VTQEPIDINDLDFESAPMPQQDRDNNLKSDEPPAATRSGGFRGFASKQAKERKTKTPPAIKSAIPNRKGQFVEPLMRMYSGIGAMVMLYDPICGTAIVTSAPKCAETMDRLAYENDAARRAIWALTRTTTMGAVFVAHLPIIMAISMHHIPAAQEAFGQLGANMMEEFLKQTTPPEDEAS
jgi:hypothetical protein